MDLTATIAPKSDQINADDLVAGPATYTVADVRSGSDEQPVDIHLVELPGRPYRPSKSMRRVLVMAWGKDASLYSGRRMTLYRDPEVTFGRDKVGGIKISHLSHIDKRQAFALTVTRGRKAAHVVEPLVEDERTLLRAEWQRATPERRAQIQARVAELEAVPAGDDMAYAEATEGGES